MSLYNSRATGATRLQKAPISKANLRTFILHQLADGLTHELILDHAYSPQEEKYAAAVQKELAEEFRTRAGVGRDLFDKLMSEALKSALAKARNKFPKVPDERRVPPTPEASSVRIPAKLKRHPRVPAADKTDSPWLSKEPSLRCVLGVVTAGGKIEIVYVRNCDPARYSSTYDFWTDDVKLRWHWASDRGVFSMEGVSIAADLRTRIETAVGKTLAASKP